MEWSSDRAHPLLRDDSDAPALIEAATHRVATHAELGRAVEQRRSELGDAAGVVTFIAAQPTIDFVVDYLAVTANGGIVALLDPNARDEVVRSWIDAYRPEAVRGFADLDRTATVTDRPATPVPPDGAIDSVLLPTSGSTGNPKFVRLSLANVVANATQIATALEIRSDHRGYAHLPLFYSFGLSVLNSHLVAGASVVLTGASAIRPEFWNDLRDHQVTSLPGVPYSFEMFRRMGFPEMDLGSLTDVTQAGGRLAADHIAELLPKLSQQDIRLWIMYGQTEASARISVLHHADAPDAIGSVGRALPEGTLRIVDPGDDGVGEIEYAGPNVMLGYAEGRPDVLSGDRQQGTLLTGDLGRLDESGRLWITGRSKRIAKVFGERINLDDVERQLLRELAGPIAAIADGDAILVVVEGDVDERALARRCDRLLSLAPRSIRVRGVPHLPTTPAGKIDYRELESG